MGQGRQIGRLIDGLDPARLDTRKVEQRVDELLQSQAIALRHRDPLALAFVQLQLVVGDRVLERAEHQRQRRAEFMADIGEELGLQFVELGQFLTLARNLALIGLLLGDVAALSRDEHDVALLVLDRTKRRIDDDRLLAAGASVDFRIPANELALRGAADHFPEFAIYWLRDLPPEGGPEWPALDVGKLKSPAVQRDLIDLEYRTFGVQQADELDHGVQRDARELLPILLTAIGGQKLGAMNADEVAGHGGNGRRFSHELALPAQITQTSRQIITHFGQSSISRSRPVVTQPEETPAKPSGSRDILDQQRRAGPRLRGSRWRGTGCRSTWAPVSMFPCDEQVAPQRIR